MLKTIFRERQLTARSRWGQGVPRPTPARHAELTIDLTDSSSERVKVLELRPSSAELVDQAAVGSSQRGSGTDSGNA